jgi:hypothetical protein
MLAANISNPATPLRQYTRIYGISAIPVTLIPITSQPFQVRSAKSSSLLPSPKRLASQNANSHMKDKNLL